MKRNLKNIFYLEVKIRGSAIILVLIMLLPITSARAVCRMTSYGEARELANTWAEAVKNRDGKAQYALYTNAYQKVVYGTYAGLNWVTGTSSPWVERYTVELTASGATVLFKYATSTGPAGSYDIHLEYTKEGSILKISDITNPELILGVVPSQTVLLKMFR